MPVTAESIFLVWFFFFFSLNTIFQLKRHCKSRKTWQLVSQNKGDIPSWQIKREFEILNQRNLGKYVFRILISIVCSPHTLPGTVTAFQIKGVNNENIGVISRGGG